jgi:LacI family transcriptional regulator, galactose operon repressor
MSTMKRVAERAGVSIATVSRVINRKGYVAPDLQEKVLQAMESLHYQPSALARGLRRRETQTVGVLVPQLAQPFFSSLGYAIEKTLFANQYRAFLCSAEEDQEKESAYIDMLLRQRVDGIILVPTGQSLTNVQRLLRAKVPIVVVDRDLPELDIDRVLCDNFGGAYEICSHLIELGHRRIGVIGSPQYSEALVRRLAGVKKALSEAGNELADELLVMTEDEQFKFGFSATRQFLQLDRPPTAVIALTDIIGVGALHAAWKAGLALPYDLSVTGFDDVALASYTLPELTTVAQPVLEMGEQAVQHLLERIRNPGLEARRTVLPTRLVVRSSTAVPRGAPQRRVIGTRGLR